MLIHSIKRQTGIAGQVAFRADVEYPDEPRAFVRFVGSVYGGPVVMQTGTVETFVSDPERFGSFGESWVRRFFGERRYSCGECAHRVTATERPSECARCGSPIVADIS